MSITNYLNKIKTAVYGKDVRGAIHDAIKECYDDASVNHDNANMEVKLARGTHNTLNDRLDNVDEIQAQTNAQLSKKMRKTGEYKIIGSFFNNEDGADNGKIYIYESNDGYNFKKTIDTGVTGRDPSILFHKGFYYIAITDYKTDCDFSVYKSEDLQNWSYHTINAGLYSDVNYKVWAPEFFVDGDDVYVIISRLVGPPTGDNWGDFRPYIMNVDLELMTATNVKAINLENYNKIDGHIIKHDGKYNLFIKDENRNDAGATNVNRIEQWQSTDLVNWEKVNDNVIEIGEKLEGVSVIKFKNTFYLYADAHAQLKLGNVVATSTDLVSWTYHGSVLGTYNEGRHGTMMVVDNIAALEIYNNAIKNIESKNMKEYINLKKIANEHGIIEELNPLDGMYYYLPPNSGNIIIESVVNKFNATEFYVLFEAYTKTDKLIIKRNYQNNSNVVAPIDIVISVENCNVDTIHTFKFLESRGKWYTTQRVFDFEQKPSLKTIELSDLADSNGNIDNLPIYNDCVYKLNKNNMDITIKSCDFSTLENTNYCEIMFAKFTDSNTGTKIIIPTSNTNFLTPEGKGFEVIESDVYYKFIRINSNSKFRKV